AVLDIDAEFAQRVTAAIHVPRHLAVGDRGALAADRDAVGTLGAVHVHVGLGRVVPVTQLGQPQLPHAGDYRGSVSGRAHACAGASSMKESVTSGCSRLRRSRRRTMSRSTSPARISSCTETRAMTRS